MSPILGIFASAVEVATTSFESIATVSVGAAGSSSIEFTSIPATYTHLQIRGIAQDNGAGTTIRSVVLRINSDTGTTYNAHALNGDGTSMSTGGDANISYITVGKIAESQSTSIFGTFVIDILDYANTNKYKTIRSLQGTDLNGSGQVQISSGAWRNTNAITSILLDSRDSFSGAFSQYSHFALYGIKAA